MKSKEMTTLHLRKSIGFLIPLAFVCLALCASPAVALADGLLCPNEQATFWTGALNNNWFDSRNWTNGVPICPNDPSLYALINMSPTAQINTGAATACGVLLGDYASDSGTLSVNGNGSSLTMCTGITVGNYGTGKLSITNGAAVTANTVASIAWGTGSNGSATVDGINNGTPSTWTVQVELDIGGTTNAAGGTGLLTVTNSGKVSAASAHVWPSGTLTGNATVSVNSGSGTLLFDGTLEPNWTLTINGNLDLTGGSTTLCNVTPGNTSPSIDAHVSGTATLRTNSKLIVNMTGNFTAGTTYTLLQADNGLNGTFIVTINYPCECFTPKIRYDAHHVYLDLNPAACCQ